MTYSIATPPRSWSMSSGSMRKIPGTMRGPVLLAIDTTPSAATLAAARAMAYQLDVPVHAITAIEPLPLLPSGEILTRLPPTYDDSRARDTDHVIRRQLMQAWGNNVDWQLEVVEGAPARVVTDEARRRNASMIVIGKGRHATVERLLGGEVTLRVAMLSTVPVLAVASDFLHAPSSAVVGVDFSVSCFNAARAALSILSAGSRRVCTLSLVHVRPPAPLGMNDWTGRYDDAVRPRLEHFVKLLEPYAGDEVRIEPYIHDGPAVDTMFDLSNDARADLLVVGTRGHGWLQRIFVGSTATSVLRRSQQSVLIAPPPAALERIRLEVGLEGHSVIEKPANWDAALHQFTERNRGRRARLEVVDPAVGPAALQVDDYAFDGATHDRMTGRLNIMMSDNQGVARHLSHGTSDVVSLEIVGGHDGRERALLIENLRGHVVLTFIE